MQFITILLVRCITRVPRASFCRSSPSLTRLCLVLLYSGQTTFSSRKKQVLKGEIFTRDILYGDLRNRRFNITLHSRAMRTEDELELRILSKICKIENRYWILIFLKILRYAFCVAFVHFVTALLYLTAAQNPSFPRTIQRYVLFF